MERTVDILIEISIYSAVITAFILLFRAAFKKRISPKVQYAMWLLLVLRLMLPVTIESVSESSADGGSNVVTFSDGKTLIIKNGSKGSTGAQGEKGLNWCGEWSDAEAYFDDDVVQFNGSAYVAATGGTTAIPDGVSPTDSPASWQLLASKGAAGTTPVKGTGYFTDADKTEMVTLVKAALTSETWTFTLSDGSTVTRKVVLG